MTIGVYELMKRILAWLMILSFILPVTLADDTWVCPGCGETVDAEFPFCPWCKHESVLPQPTNVSEQWFCTNCGHWNDARFPNCPFCTGSREEVRLKDNEWYCVNCKRINKGSFCGGCGKSREEAAVTPPPKVTPSPMPPPPTPTPTPTPVPVPEPTPKPTVVPDPAEELQAIKKAQVGDVVTYGRYPQKKGGTDETPVEWIVLDVRENKALLLSQYALDSKPYNDQTTTVTWETCTLRAWLNGEFLSMAFSKGERKAILTTVVDNSESQIRAGWNAIGGNDTRDQIFLLSYGEAKTYLGFNGSSSMSPRAIQTPYAKMRSGQSFGTYKQESGNWWLRSPGRLQNYAAIVQSDGSEGFVQVGHYEYTSDATFVRPALWIDLSANTD